MCDTQNELEFMTLTETNSRFKRGKIVASILNV